MGCPSISIGLGLRHLFGRRGTACQIGEPTRKRSPSYFGVLDVRLKPTASVRVRETNIPWTCRFAFPSLGFGALKRLNNAEIDGLLAAVTAEAERRGWLPPSRTKEKPTADGRPQPRQAPAEHGTSSLTTGKLNAVRAAFKAGVKPSAIARQFGISPSDVSKALATRAGTENLVANAGSMRRGRVTSAEFQCRCTSSDPSCISRRRGSHAHGLRTQIGPKFKLSCHAIPIR
jgi:hypothetical protein